jgi:hypothetical protein
VADPIAKGEIREAVRERYESAARAVEEGKAG